MDLSWYALTSQLRTGQNSLTHWKARIWLSRFSKQTHPPKPAEVEPSLLKLCGMWLVVWLNKG